MEKLFNSLRGNELERNWVDWYREVQVWDVKKLQIQSELFLPSSHETQGIAVDGHRGIIYTLSPEGVICLFWELS